MWEGSGRLKDTFPKCSQAARDFRQVEFYDEYDELVKSENAYEIKVMGGRTLPSKFDIQPADKPKQKTVITIQSIKFNVPIEDSFFTQQSMKSVR